MVLPSTEHLIKLLKSESSECGNTSPSAVRLASVYGVRGMVAGATE